MFPRLLLTLLVVLVAWAVLARPSDTAGPERTYVVRPYDTLWSIAAKHYDGDPRSGVWRLQQRNGLRGTIIRPGQKIALP
jgi:hypothetical protein